MTVMQPIDAIDVRPAAPRNAGEANIIVRPAVETDNDAWRRFVEAREDATPFHLPGWARAVNAAYGHSNRSLVAMRGESVCGVLPLNHVKSPLFGSSLISTAFAVGGGLLASDAAAADALAREAARLGGELGVDHVELRSEQATLADWKTKSDVYAVFRKDIPEDEDANLKMIPRKKRADVRKSLKGDLTVDADASIDDFYKLYARSVHFLGTPVFPKKWIEALKREFGEDMEISLTLHKGAPVTSLVTFYFRDQVLPYYAGSTPLARPTHGYDYQYWSLMRRGLERGGRIFDFGRSKYGAGSFDYKTYWGFEPTALNYQYHLIGSNEVPDVNPMNPKYRLMVAAWRRMPLVAANALGPFIARQLG